MANIRVDIGSAPFDGQELNFKAPCDCAKEMGLKIVWPEGNAVYALVDATCQGINLWSNVFKTGAIVKVSLDTVNKRAFVMNAATNAYLEGKVMDHTYNMSNPHGVTKAQVGLSNVTNDKQMPIAGGTFTGNAAAWSTARNTTCLRNIKVTNKSGSAVTTDYIIMERKV